MFENLKKITVKGGCFESSTELEIFRHDALSIIYGRNGSGKSTIGNCFREMIKTAEDRIPSFEVSSDIGIDDSYKEYVHIFNEDFVNEQVKFKNDGISTIVMLGEQVELDILISKKQTDLNERIKQFEVLDKLQSRYNNPKDSISPEFNFKRLKDALSVDQGWADIDSQSKENKVKSRITSDVVNTLMSLQVAKESLEDLYESRKSALLLFHKSKGAQAIEWSKTPLVAQRDLTWISDLLKHPLDKPELTDREQRLLNMLSQHSVYKSDDTKNLLDKGFTFCPLCLREITVQDRSDIVLTLTHILNEEAAKYQHVLDGALRSCSMVQASLPIFGEGLNDKELNEARSALDIFNKLLESIRLKINERMQNLYEPLQMPFDDSSFVEYVEAFRRLESALDAISNCVDKFNESVKKRSELKKRIQLINNSLARKQHASLFDAYQKSISDKGKNLNDLSEQKKECDKLGVEIKDLKSQKERTDIALHYINDLLQYVFYSKKKFYLEAGEGCYRLKVKGKSVKPRHISVGERNVLALCYFFAKLFSEKTETTRYTSEYLIIIDDPVSSFDYDNRVGVMSLLRYQIGKILRGNSNSRILVMSHDIQSVFDLVKIRNEVTLAKEGKDFFNELSNKSIGKRKISNEYKKLINYVFQFAKGPEEGIDEILELGIGNMMRRILEAFSSFSYNSQFENVVRNAELLQKIPGEKRAYYESFMNRLILNTESHTKETAYALTGINAHFTKEEKVQTAKSVLLFLSYINPHHLKSYLEEEEMNEVEKWKKEEVNWL